MKELERVLITVKTYPTISAANVETVCTGGINVQGQWRRIYPVPFRYLGDPQQYRVFDVVDVKLGPGQDDRPESRRPDNSTLRVVNHIDDWRERNRWVAATIEPSMKAMQDKGRTLCPVAASEVMEFVAAKAPAEWTEKQQAKLAQELLFDERKALEKIPWEFRLRWRDGDGNEQDSLFISWEVMETYRQYRQRYPDPVKVMRDHWMTRILGPDRQVSLFMGNMAGRRHVYMACGTFTPPRTATTDGDLFVQLRDDTRT